MAKEKVIRVTMTRDYLVPMANDTVSQLDGRTLDEIVQEWFKAFPLGIYHASREAFAIGNSEKFEKAEVLPVEALKRE